MPEPRYYVYRTINNVNSKIYVGVHRSYNIEKDSYLGSGVLLEKAIQKYGEQNFSREILCSFENSEKAYQLEKSIVNEQFVKNPKTYNLKCGGYGGYMMLSVDGKRFVGITKGKTIAKDSNGQIFHVSITDPRLTKGQLTSLIKGKLSSRDKDGNHIWADKFDPRFKNGELIANSKGKILVINKENHKTSLSKDDPKYLNEEYVPLSRGKVLVKDKTGKCVKLDMSQFYRNKGTYQSVAKGTVMVENPEGNLIRISTKHPDYISGKFVPFNKGISKVLVKNELGEYFSISLQEYQNNKDKYVGSTKNNIWINNEENELLISKYDNIPKGWKLGRCVKQKLGWKKGNARNTIWVTNGIETKQIKNNQSIPLGWKTGRTVKTNNNSFWITNGVTNKMVNNNQDIQKGWFKGRTISKRNGF